MITLKIIDDKEAEMELISDPFVKEEEVTHTTGELLQMLSDSFKKSDELIGKLKKELR